MGLFAGPISLQLQADGSHILYMLNIQLHLQRLCANELRCLWIFSLFLFLSPHSLCFVSPFPLRPAPYCPVSLYLRAFLCFITSLSETCGARLSLNQRSSGASRAKGRLKVTLKQWRFGPFGTLHAGWYCELQGPVPDTEAERGGSGWPLVHMDLWWAGRGGGG